MGLSKQFSFIREIWNEINKDLKKTLKHTARISEIKNLNKKTYFTVQLIGKSTCSWWMTALELTQNKQLFHALNPEDQELVKCTCRIEYNTCIGSKQAIFFISAIDFDPECMISIASINGFFQIKLTPNEIFLNKKIFNNINSSDQGYVKFYAGSALTEAEKIPLMQSSNIISFKKYKLHNFK